MGCCGQSRARYEAERRSITRPAPEAKTTAKGVTLEYIGLSEIVVRGPNTGRTYTFSPGSKLEVDSRDSDALRRTRLFR